MLLNYHIGCIFLGFLSVGVRVWFGWGGIRAEGFGPEKYSQCGSSTT